ncbi:conserved Plasmodium protein, unknown function [Plasmodium knowlesi strain H]|uniref:Uncharacterized protein n=1 Tax=Plasmodium knowlesi (strain H) TaxID=5851 RepID=A0A1A7VLJ4_PLAKH|nr:conserved Plasmodium protein, unknown function [Plasmodium knowlesi strain H]
MGCRRWPGCFKTKHYRFYYFLRLHSKYFGLLLFFLLAENSRNEKYVQQKLLGEKSSAHTKCLYV